jgi:hypothetical protein
MGTGYGVYVYRAYTTQPTFVDTMLRPGAAYNYRVTQFEPGQEVVLAQVNAVTPNDPSTPSRPNPPAVEVTPAPTALPPDTVLLGLLSDNSVTDNFETMTIVGEVRNDANLHVGQAKIMVTFYDAAGSINGTATGETILDVLSPGEVSPFAITLERPAGMVSYSLRAVARPAAPKLTPQLAVVETRRYEDEAGFLHIKGTIENVGTLEAKRARVAVIIYEGNGQIINAGLAASTPATLLPGAKAAYEVAFSSYNGYAIHKVIAFEE